MVNGGQLQSIKSRFDGRRLQPMKHSKESKKKNYHETETEMRMAISWPGTEVGHLRQKTILRDRHVGRPRAWGTSWKVGKSWKSPPKFPHGIPLRVCMGPAVGFQGINLPSKSKSKSCWGVSQINIDLPGSPRGVPSFFGKDQSHKNSMRTKLVRSSRTPCRSKLVC